MTESRRRMVVSVAGALAVLMTGSPFSRGQLPRPARDPRPYPNGRNPGAPPDSDDPVAPESKIQLLERQKQIRAYVARLYEMAADLKSEVEKTDATAILSVSLVKKAHEIEKLAKEIKNLARSSS